MTRDTGRRPHYGEGNEGGGGLCDGSSTLGPPHRGASEAGEAADGSQAVGGWVRALYNIYMESHHKCYLMIIALASQFHVYLQ